MGMTFGAGKPVYDVGRGVVLFVALDGALMVRCAVSREALMDKAGVSEATDAEVADIFVTHADRIQAVAFRKYEAKHFEPDGSVLIKTADLNRR